MDRHGEVLSLISTVSKPGTDYSQQRLQRYFNLEWSLSREQPL